MSEIGSAGLTAGSAVSGAMRRDSRVPAGSLSRIRANKDYGPAGLSLDRDLELFDAY
jgi:hypothetical protein